MTMGLQGYGQPGDWQDDIYYPIGQTVADRGGIWRALVQNRNSEPISGNTDWTLIAGTPYVDVTLSPVDLTTAPLLNSTGYVVIPAPWETGVVILPMFVASMVSLGDAWGSSGGFNFYWTSTSGANAELGFNPPMADISTLPAVNWNPQTNANVPGPGSAENANQQIVIGTTTDPSSGGTGTRSLAFRLWYTLTPSSSLFTSTFFTITAVDQTDQVFTVSPDPTSDVIVGTAVTVVGSTANDGTYTVTVVAAAAGPDNITVVNQGTKKFTIAGDHHTEYPAGSIATVAGSTGNDGVYTVVSAVFGTATVITVSEAIPNATADGTIEMTDQIVVAQAIPDSTADGWVEVS